MPSNDAHSSRNWAMTMHAPAAMSWVSLMASETKARTVATVNAATANESCMGLLWNITFVLNIETTVVDFTFQTFVIYRQTQTPVSRP